MAAITTILENLPAEAVVSRDSGEVHTIHGEAGSTVAEVCVGKKFTRLNFRHAVPEDIEVSLQDGSMLTTSSAASKLGGKSKSWQGGGVRLDDANVESWLPVIEAVRALDVKAEEPEAEATEEPSAEAAAAKLEAAASKPKAKATK